MSYKKGMAAGTLVAMIITLAAFMLIASVIMNFVGQADEKQAELLCHDSIALRAATQINENGKFVKSEVKPVPVLCKTIDKKVSGNREEIKQEIANKIARCWWMFGEGKYEKLLYGSSFTILPALFDFENSDDKCFNCYAVLIDENNIDGGPIMAEEITQYLKVTPYPKLTNVTYLEYIQSYGGPGRVAFSAPAILPNEAYAISMMPKNKKVGEGDFWKGVAKVGVGAVIVIGVVGATVCIIGTGGACAAFLGAAVAGSGTAVTSGALVVAATSGVVTAAGTTATVLVTTSAGYMAYSGYQNMMSTMYGERDVSSIYVGFLKVGQEKCGSGDVVGK